MTSLPMISLPVISEWPITHQELPYSVSIDIDTFDFEKIHIWLSNDAYWSKGIPFDVCLKSFQNSLSYGLFYKGSEQIGCARMISDEATFAYLADVYIQDEHRGKGLGHWFISSIMNDERLQGLRKMMLATANMHPLYEKFGFRALENPEIIMERTNPSIYTPSHKGNEGK